MRTSHLKRLVIGAPFPTKMEIHERLDKMRALAVFASDPISSNAYATEAIMGILIVMGSGALALTIPIAIAIALLILLVVFSYIQTILHYPAGGGAYTVAKDNLGTLPSLIAASALLIDYVLTVSVSVSAGVRAVSSAFPVAHEYRIVISLVVIAVITLINLRGVRESGTIFAIPTYAFVGGVILVIGLGLVRYFGLFGAAPLIPAPPVPALEPHVGLVYVWLLLRAFAAGCTALTGIEAISNGVPAFKPPEALNAAKTMVAMGGIAMTLFLGISFLATHLRIVPSAEISTLAQMTEAISGRGFLYFWVQFFTAMILFLAANTGYQDFPRLGSYLAKDGFMPRWLQNRGDRLAFSSGILVLAVLASIIVIIFQADEIAMLPLYALGVMLCFTLSQAGMVRLMGKVAKVPPGESVQTSATTIHYEQGWWWKRAVNLVGCITTGIVFIVLLSTKFLEGAWIVALSVPLIILLFRGVKHHYQEVAKKLGTRGLTVLDIPEVADVVIVPIADVHRGVLRALKYAKRLSTNVRAVSVITDPESRERIQKRWDRFSDLTADEQLIFIEYDYRNILSPLVDYITHVNKEEFPNQLITVVIPEFVPDSLAEQLLHNQTANMLRWRLRSQPDVVVIDVPYHV